MLLTKDNIRKVCFFAAFAAASLQFTIYPVSASEQNILPAETESSWDKAGEEIGEAAQAVGAAGKQSWDSAAKSGAEVWEKTREGAGHSWQEVKASSGEVWEETKTGTEQGVRVTKEESRSFWHKVKKKSKSWYDRIRGEVH